MAEHTPSRSPFREEADQPFEIRHLADHLGALRIAVRRHRGLALGAVVLVLACTALGLALTPKTYVSRARILVQRNEQGLNLGEGDRNFWREVQPPAQGAADSMRARAHLERAIDDTDLVTVLRAHRQLVRRAAEALLGAPKDAAALRQMTLEVLDQRIKVDLAPDGTAITLEVTWADPATAARLAESLVRSYLAARKAFEVDALESRLGDIERRADAAQSGLAAALDRSRAEYARGLSELEHAVRGAASSPASAAERELARVKTDLLARRQAIADYEEHERRQRAELQARLHEQEATLAPDHPALQETRGALAAGVDAPGPLSELRAQERALFERYLALGGRDPSLVETGPLRAVTEALLAGARFERDPAIGQARAALEAAQDRYRRLRERLDAARLELEAMRASFAARYDVVQPAQVPLRPAAPNVPLALLGALAVGVALGGFLAFAAHLREDRVHQLWQIRRQLGIPVLAQVRAPSAHPPAEARRA